MNKQVLPSHRYAINKRIIAARKIDSRDIVAGIENVACYWDSFPDSYSADKVAAAAALIVAVPGTSEYQAALVVVADILRAQGSIIPSELVGKQ